MTRTASATTKPRFEARAEVHGESIWAIFDRGVAQYNFSESEAKIMAWALNGIAEGRVIVKLMPPGECPDGARYAGFYCHDYTGPTDDIAPPDVSQPLGKVAS